MKYYLLLILINSFFILSCQNQTTSTKEKELQLKEVELKLKEQEIINEKRTELDRKENELSKERENFEAVKQQSTKASKYYAKGYGSFPETSTRYIDYSDIRALSSYELKIMRNEIFARHGYIFKTEDMKQYFNQQSWYRPLYSDVTNLLTPIEKSNVEFMKKFE